MNQTTPIVGVVVALLIVAAIPAQPAAHQKVAETSQSAEDRRREAAAAARARARYEAEVHRRKRPEEPRRQIEQPAPQALCCIEPTHQPRRSGVRVGALLRGAAQIGRTVERAERGRFDPWREVSRAGRMIERHERRRW